MLVLPAYGKFAQVDPAYDQTKDDPESWNLYNYVTNNPVTNTDPDGRTAEAADGSGSGGGDGQPKKAEGQKPEDMKAAPPPKAQTRWQRFKQAFSNLGKRIEAKVNAPHPGNSMSAEALENFRSAIEITVVNATLLQIVALETLPTGANAQSGEAAATGAGSEMAAVKPTTPSGQLNIYDSDFAAQQALGGTNVTPGGRTITGHAAERMVSPGPGRAPMTMGEVDRVLDGATRIIKVDHTHPSGPTITVQNQNMSGKPKVVVDESGKRIVTVIKNN